MSELIDGKKVAEGVFAECREDIAALASLGITPGLAVVVVGSDPASLVYVGSKARRCQ